MTGLQPYHLFLLPFFFFFIGNTKAFDPDISWILFHFILFIFIFISALCFFHRRHISRLCFSFASLRAQAPGQFPTWVPSWQAMLPYEGPGRISVPSHMAYGSGFSLQSAPPTRVEALATMVEHHHNVYARALGVPIRGRSSAAPRGIDEKPELNQAYHALAHDPSCRDYFQRSEQALKEAASERHALLRERSDCWKAPWHFGGVFGLGGNSATTTRHSLRVELQRLSRPEFLSGALVCESQREIQASFYWPDDALPGVSARSCLFLVYCFSRGR